MRDTFSGWFEGLTQRHPLILIFLVALIVRCTNIAVVGAGGGRFIVEDDFFIQIAFEWAQFLGLMAGTPATDGFWERVPLFPLVIAFLSLFGAANPIGIAVANSIFDAGTCVVIGLLGCRIDRRLGLVAGLVAAIWPNLVIHSGVVLSDSLFVLIFTGMLYWSARYLAQPNYRTAAIAGLLLGLAVLTRPVAQFLIPAMTLAAFGIVLYQGESKRRAILLAASLMVPAVLIIAPLVAHNQVKFGVSALSSQSGTHLAYWIVPPVKRAETGASLNKTVAEIRAAYETERKRRELEKPNPFVSSQMLSSVALAELGSSSPIAIAKAWAKGMAVNLASPAILIDTRVRALATQSFYGLEAPHFAAKVWRYVSGNGPIYMALFLLGALGGVATLGLSAYGFMLLWRHQPWAAAFAALAVLYFLLVNGPVASPKYRLPIEPIMVILTAMGGLGLWDRFRGQKGSVG